MALFYVRLTDGASMTWSQLIDAGGSALEGKVAVLSACESEGLSEICSAMRIAKKPAILVVGAQRPVTYEESVIGWPLFYFTVRRSLGEGRDLKDSFQRGVKLVNAVCGNFCVYHRWDDDRTNFLRFAKSAEVDWDPPEDK